MALCHKAIDGVAAGTAMVDSNGNVYGSYLFKWEVMNPVAETNYRFRGILILTGCYQQYMRNLH
jgi:hypothetical protein